MIRIITDPAELDSLEPAWNDLAERLGRPLLRHEWFDACARVLCPSGRLRVVVIYSGEEIRAIAPLVLTRYNGIESLEFLGMSILFEEGGFIYGDEASLEELINAILSLKKPVILRRIRSDSIEIQVMKQLCRKRVFMISKEDAVLPFLPLKMRSQEFESKISSRKRATLRRKLRQAERAGQVSFEVISPDPENVEKYLEEVLRVEASGWKRKSGTDILSNPGLHKFFTLYASKAAQLNMLRLFILRIDGIAVAMRMAVEYADRLWELKIGYDEKWASCSPGVILTHKTITHACNAGFEAIEFLGTDAPWVHMWSDSRHACRSLHVYPFTPGGMFGLAINKSRDMARKLIKG